MTTCHVSAPYKCNCSIEVASVNFLCMSIVGHSPHVPTLNARFVVELTRRSDFLHPLVFVVFSRIKDHSGFKVHDWRFAGVVGSVHCHVRNFLGGGVGVAGCCVRMGG